MGSASREVWKSDPLRESSVNEIVKREGRGKMMSFVRAVALRLVERWSVQGLPGSVQGPRTRKEVLICIRSESQARLLTFGSFPHPLTIGCAVIVARKKPKSTRRKHHHHSHHSHHARRPRSRRGTSESFSSDLAAEGSRSVRASRETSAAAATSASAADARQASSTVTAAMSPPSELLAPSSSSLPSAAIPSTPVTESVDDGGEAMAALSADAATLPVAATAGDGHGKRSEGTAHGVGVAVDAKGSDRCENGPADATVTAAASEGTPASRRGEREVSPVTQGGEADGGQGATSGYAQDVQDCGQTTRLVGSSALPPEAVAGGAGDGSIRSAATDTPSQVLNRRSDGNGAATVGPDGVTINVESCPQGGSVGESPKPETGGSTIITVNALASSRKDAVAAAVTDLGVPPGSSDALALAHIFLSSRRGSSSALTGGRGSCFETAIADIDGTREGDDGPTSLLTQQSPLRDGASVAGRDARSVGTGGVAAEDIAARCASGTCACYPGGKEESSGMKQHVVAVEAISPRAAAWLSGGSAVETSAAAGITVLDDPSADSDSSGRSDSDDDDDLENGKVAIRLEESRIAAPSGASHGHPGEGSPIFSGVGSGCAQLKEKLKDDEKGTVVGDNGRGGVSRGDRYSCSAVIPTAGEVAVPAGAGRATVASARFPPIMTSGLGLSPKASADAVVRAFGETANRRVLS